MKAQIYTPGMGVEFVQQKKSNVIAIYTIPRDMKIWRCYILYEGSYVHALLTNEYSEKMFM